MKKLLTFAAVAVITMASMTQAANIFTGGAGAGDPSWFNGANWDIGEPGAGDEAWLDTSVSYGPVVDAAGATAASMIVGIYGHDGDLTIDAAGELSVGGNVLVANGVADIGSIVNNGELNAGNFYTHAGTATIENNGIINATDMLLGHLAGSHSTFSNTGDINVANWMYLAVAGTDSTFNMNGGTLDVGARLEMAPGGSAHLNLHGGTITTVDFGLNGDGNYTIDVTGDGKLIANGDHEGGMDWMISVGLITGDVGVDAVYDIGTNKTTLSVIPEPATLSLFGLLGGGMLWVRKRFKS